MALPVLLMILKSTLAVPMLTTPTVCVIVMYSFSFITFLYNDVSYLFSIDFCTSPNGALVVDTSPPLAIRQHTSIEVANHPVASSGNANYRSVLIIRRETPAETPAKLAAR